MLRHREVLHTIETRGKHDLNIPKNTQIKIKYDHKTNSFSGQMLLNDYSEPIIFNNKIIKDGVLKLDIYNAFLSYVTEDIVTGYLKQKKQIGRILMKLDSQLHRLAFCLTIELFSILLEAVIDYQLL